MSDIQLRDTAGFDFRLQDGAAAVDSGIIIPGITDGFIGEKPDIGAYESGGIFWKAGAGTHDTIPETAIGKPIKQNNHSSPVLSIVKSSSKLFEIALQIPVTGNVTLQLQTLTGQTVSTLFHGKMKRGTHTVMYMNKTARGMYILRFQAANMCISRNILVGF